MMLFVSPERNRSEWFFLRVLGVLGYGVTREGRAYPVLQVAGPTERLTRYTSRLAYVEGEGNCVVEGELFQ